MTMIDPKGSESNSRDNQAEWNHLMDDDGDYFTPGGATPPGDSGADDSGESGDL